MESGFVAAENSSGLCYIIFSSLLLFDVITAGSKDGKGGDGDVVFRSSSSGDSSSNKKEISWLLPYLSKLRSELLLDASRGEILKRSNRFSV